MKVFCNLLIFRKHSKISNVFNSYNKLNIYLLQLNRRKTNIFDLNVKMQDKYSPILDLSFFGIDSFFFKIASQRLLLSYITGTQTKFTSLNFFKIKMDPIKFRKRKNIYFNIAYKAKFKSKLKNIDYIWKLFTLIHNLENIFLNTYKMNMKLLKINYSKKKLNIVVLNPQYLMSFFSDQQYPPVKFLINLEIFFNNTKISQYLKNYLIQQILNLKHSSY